MKKMVPGGCRLIVRLISNELGLSRNNVLQNSHRRSGNAECLCIDGAKTDE